METLILHYDYQRSLNDQYVQIHTKAQQITESHAGMFLKIFQKWGDKPYTEAVKQDIFSYFSKVEIFFKTA